MNVYPLTVALERFGFLDVFKKNVLCIYNRVVTVSGYMFLHLFLSRYCNGTKTLSKTGTTMSIMLHQELLSLSPWKL